MRKITLILTTLIFFSVMFSSTSFAGWTKVDENVEGNTFYVDFERIRKHDGYVYYWELIDLLKPTEYGDLSGKGYVQGDCKKFRYKHLSISIHKSTIAYGPYVMPEQSRFMAMGRGNACRSWPISWTAI
jgi:hypothetical protein